MQYLILAGEKSNQIRGAQAGFDFLKRASQISETAKLALDAQTEVRLLIELASAQQAVGSIGDAVKGFRKSIELSRRHALVDYEKEGLRNLLDRMPVDPGKGLAEADQRALLKRGGETIQKKRIVFHPGSGGKGKNHPPEFWRELIGKVTGRFPSPSLFRSVVLLGPAEEPLLPFFTGQVGGEQAEILFAPELEQLLSILTQAPLYVGHDSGITHLAAKLGTPTIALFKNSSVQQWRPLGPRVRVVESEKNRKTLMRKVLEEAGKCIGTQYTSSTPRAT